MAIGTYTRLTPHIAVSDARFVDIGVECDITLEVYQSVDYTVRDSLVAYVLLTPYSQCLILSTGIQ